jgi:hypothetical protein
VRGVWLATVCGVTLGVTAGAVAQPPPNATKLIEMRYSIVGQYRFSTNTTVPYTGCTVAFQGSGGGDARLDGRARLYYQRYNTPEGERISARINRANPRARVFLNRFGTLQATETCPGRAPTVRHSLASGCRTRSMPLRYEAGLGPAGRRRGERPNRNLMPALQLGNIPLSELFDRSEPCPPTRGPYGINFTTSSSFPWGGYVDEGSRRLIITERELLRSRFIRRSWSFRTDANLVARDVGRPIGTQQRVWTMRVLYCSVAAGGCGNRKP